MSRQVFELETMLQQLIDEHHKLLVHVDKHQVAMRAFDRLFTAPAPYMSGWHQAPVRHGRDEFALHLELFTIRRASGKLKYLAGSESGMGAFVNDVEPEAAAERLRRLC